MIIRREWFIFVSSDSIRYARFSASRTRRLRIAAQFVAAAQPVWFGISAVLSSFQFLATCSSLSLAAHTLPVCPSQCVAQWSVWWGALCGPVPLLPIVSTKSPTGGRFKKSARLAVHARVRWCWVGVCVCVCVRGSVFLYRSTPVPGGRSRFLRAGWVCVSVCVSVRVSVRGCISHRVTLLVHRQCPIAGSSGSPSSPVLFFSGLRLVALFSDTRHRRTSSAENRPAKPSDCPTRRGQQDRVRTAGRRS